MNAYRMGRKVTSYVWGTVHAESEDAAVSAVLRGEEVDWEYDTDVEEQDYQGEGAVIELNDEFVGAADYAREHDLDVYMCGRCGGGIKAGQEFVEFQHPDTDEHGYRHVLAGDCD